MRKEGISLRVKIGVGALAFCAAVALAFCFFSHTPNYDENALEALFNNDLESCEKSLAKWEKKESLDQGLVQLRRGLLALHQESFDDARAHFLAALRLAPSEGGDELLTEVFLGQALLAFMEGRDHAVPPLIEEAKEHMRLHGAISFLDGLVSYFRDSDFPKAFDAWEAYDENVDANWFSCVIDQHFPRSYRDIHKARALIAVGEYGNAREMLEEYDHVLTSTDERLSDLCSLFLGISYLKEGERVTAEDRAKLDQLATYYLSCSNPTGLREEEDIISQLQTSTFYRLLSLEDLARDNVFHLISSLELYGATQALDWIADAFVVKSQEVQNRSLCRALRMRIEDSAFHRLLTQKMHALVLARVRLGEVESLPSLWEAVLAIAPQSIEKAGEIGELLQHEIVRLIHQDAQSLDQTREMLAFWEELELPGQERLALTNLLMQHGQLLWRGESQERKGMELMDLALAFARNDERSFLMDQIESFLVGLHRQAESANTVHRLNLIHEALGRFSIGGVVIASKEKVANHVADAGYLFSVSNYNASKEHAEWVLKLQPGHQEALRLLGLSSYHLGDFELACLTLSQLAEPDSLAEQALMFSRVYAMQDSPEQIASRIAPEDLTEE